MKVKMFLIYLAVMLLPVSVVHAQQKISDGTANAPINPDALLELQTAKKGLLLPRVKLDSTSSFSPMTARVEGMTVYNTVAAGSGTTAVTPGYYYNDGTKWVRLYSIPVGGTSGQMLTTDGSGGTSWKSVTQTITQNVSVTSMVDANILGYTPSTTATACTNAPATVTVGSSVATRVAYGTYSGNGHSYASYYTNTSLTWYEAYYAAKAMGGYLATFTTVGEWQYVETTLMSGTYSPFITCGAWIGMCKFSWKTGTAMSPDPDMKWITGELPYHDYSEGGTAAVTKVNWFASGEPNNASGIEGFVHTLYCNYTGGSGASVTKFGYTSTHAWNDVPASGTSSGVPILGNGGFIVEFQQ